MITIKDVARVAGVSPSTVSRVVRGTQGKVGEKVRVHVQKVIDEMGYRPNINARSLVSQKSEMIGVVSPGFQSHFFGALASGVGEMAQQYKYNVMMASSTISGNSEEEAINSLRDHGCECIVLHNRYSSEAQIIALAEKVPGLVIINSFIDKLANRCVWLDNVSGGRMTAAHLYDKGHRDFAVITNERQMQDPMDRLRGVQDFLKSKQIDLPNSNIAKVEPSILGSEKGIRELIERDIKFSALIAYNDTMAIGAMNILQDLGYRIPEDISVVGYDDVMIASTCRPYLTTVRYPMHEMGAYAAKLSINLAHHKEKPEPKTHLFMPSMVERNSVFSKSQ